MGEWLCIYKMSYSKYCYDGREIRIIQQLEQGRDFYKAKFKVFMLSMQQMTLFIEFFLAFKGKLPKKIQRMCVFSYLIFLFLYMLPCLPKAPFFPPIFLLYFHPN